MRIFLDTVNRRLLVAANILAILTVGPCAVVAPQRLRRNSRRSRPSNNLRNSTPQRSMIQ